MTINQYSGCAARVLALHLIFAFSVYGHAILLSALPAAKGVVNGPTIPVQLRFNSRIDAKRSRITLVASDGRQTALPVEHVAADTIGAEARDLRSGIYILRWQVLANDGHITRGEVRFQVH